MKKDFLTDDIQKLIIFPEKWEIIFQKKTPVSQNSFESHKHREIMLALSGSCTYAFDQDYYQCTPGTLFLINHNVGHEYFDLSKTEQLLHLWVYFLNDYSTVVRCISIAHENIQVLSFAILPPSNDLDLEYLWDCLDEASTEQERAHQLQLLKLAIALRFGQFLKSSEMARDQYHLVVVGTAIKRIQDNLKYGIDVAQLAKASGYTRFHFSRIFRQVTGGTIQNYIDQCRLNKLKELRKHNLLQKEISEQLGFENPRSYYKWRKKHLPK